MTVPDILFSFAERFQREDIDVDDVPRLFPGVEVVEIELQNAFVYDYVIVEYEGKRYKISYDSGGYVMKIAGVREDD